MRLPGGGDGCDLPGIIRFGWAEGESGRILVVEYYDPSLTDGCTSRAYAPVRFQVRLYEGSNQIEFYYESMSPEAPDCFGGGTATTSASIGLASANGFISVTPRDSEATSSTETDNNSIDLQNNPIEDGVTYLFCPAKVAGNTKEGGTEKMKDGDVLLQERAIQRYNSATYRPFTMNSPCAANFSYSISGPNAGDYTISPTNGELDPEKGNTPTLTFLPTGTGLRLATLSVRDDRGFVVRSYTLAGEGITRSVFVGDVSQGGTPDLDDGDILMENIKVRNGSSASFTPIRIGILPGNSKSTPNAPIRYTLDDPTGQFSIDRTFENVAPGESSVPVITFAPNGHIDRQRATLTVEVEGEIRVYILRPFASGPGARFYVGNNEFSNGAALFRTTTGCVGEQVYNIAFEIRAIGDEEFVMNDLDVFQVDSRIGPGTPAYPLMRDAFGRLVELPDYFVSGTAGSREPLELPIVLQPGESRTIYLTFNPNRPGRRSARAFFNTNGENFIGLDKEQDASRGTINVELTGDGIGGRLSNVAGDGLPTAIVFDRIDVRTTTTATGYIRNVGSCDLRIKGDNLKLVAGDIKEFAIVSAFPNSFNSATGDYVIPAGGMDSVIVSFTPTRSGSRRASLRIQTNDSLAITPGVNARGETYIDLFGVGNVGLESRAVVLPPAVINADPSQGNAVVENTSSELLTITGIQMVSATGEFTENTAKPWPVLPMTMEPGQTLDLSLLFTPDPANGPGQRAAALEVTLSNGNVLTVDIRALAGTRELSVTPMALFQSTQVPVGEIRRAFTLITNAGTFPVEISNYALTGANAADYRVGNIPYGVIQPGQTLPVEITFIPSVAGPTPAVLEFTTNSTNGTPAGVHIVTLGGEGTSMLLDGDGSGGSAVTIPETGDHSKNLAPVAAVAQLQEISPNPVATTAAIRYEIPSDGEVQLALYDMQGSLVRRFVTEAQSAGSHTAQANLQGLPSGRYVVYMQFGETVKTQVLNLVK